MQFDTTYSTQQSQHKACHDSTLRVFSVKTTHWFDVTGFFSKKNSFAIWHYIFNTTKSTKRLSRFDVTGFFSKKTAHLQSDITYSTQQSQHKACHDSTLRVFSVKRTHWFDVTGFFSKKNSFAIWHYIFNTTKST